MGQPVVVVHERIATWARQLRPRLAGSAGGWAETRSAADLARRLLGAVVPVVVLDLADAPAARLEEVALARRESPDALILVLEPRDRPGVPALARELGATRVLAGPATPPEVAEVVSRWVRLSRQRARAGGWPARPRGAPAAQDGPPGPLGSFVPPHPAPDRAASAPPSPRNPA